MKTRRRTACPFEILEIPESYSLLFYYYSSCCHFPGLIIVLVVNVLNIDLHTEGGRTFRRPDRHVITKISRIYRLQRLLTHGSPRTAYDTMKRKDYEN